MADAAPGDRTAGAIGQDAAVIQRFVDALWLEDGLAALTLAAYRRDLQLLSSWLNQRDEIGRASCRERVS
jgi:integrase/recombinase XerD